MRKPRQYGEKETPPDGNQQSTNTACGGMIHNPRTAEQSDLNWSHFIQVLLLLFFIFHYVSRSNVKKGAGGEHLWVSFIQHNPWSSFAVVIATLWFSSCGQRGQQRAGCRPEQCHYRLSLNQASIRIHCLQERCSGRGERGVHSKHPQAGTNRRNAPKAKMVNQRLKDNLGQISEHPCSGRKKKPSNYSKPAKKKRELQHLCWRRCEIDYM